MLTINNSFLTAMLNVIMLTCVLCLWCFVAKPYHSYLRKVAWSRHISLQKYLLQQQG